MKLSTRSLFASLVSWSVLLLTSGAVVIRDAGNTNGMVTFDKHSIIVNGKPLLLFSGEVHPFRIPVPGLWLDIFQKIRSMGFTAVSFYTNWALHEGEPGVFQQDGVFSIKGFIDAAKEAGIYLIARPGPYINGEVSGGGLPGWIQRVNGPPRTRNGTDAGFLGASMNYWQFVCEVIAAAQVTNGGPVIMVQIENEYVFDFSTGYTFDPGYMQAYIDTARQAGLVVPFSYNDVTPPQSNGIFAYGRGEGSVDVIGQDSYPLGFACWSPEYWPPGGRGLPFPTDYARVHQKLSPKTPMSLPEYQGGSVDGWGGYGYDNCARMVNGAAFRLFWGAAASFVTTVHNVYMIFGGTNWGNIGQPDGYTSYDYGAAIAEDRTIFREKYRNGKLVATFLASSPEYLQADPQDNTHQYGAFTQDKALATSQAWNKLAGTRFFIVRHSDFGSYDRTTYKMSIPTKLGNITIPQSIDGIVLNGRDSKIHVVDYPIGNGVSIWYSSADIFTYNADGPKSVLVLYGGNDEPQELAFATKLPKPTILEGNGIKFSTKQGRQVLSWMDAAERRVVDLGRVRVYILDRDSAQDYWRLQISSESNPPFIDTAKPSVIVSGGYLMRSASVNGNTLSLTGDITNTTELEVIAAPAIISHLKFNGQDLAFKATPYGSLTATVNYQAPTLDIPDLQSLPWKYIDSLPELSAGYDDGKWTLANIKRSHNDEFQQSTPTSLSSSDYGFNSGSVVFRGHFNATGDEKWFSIGTAGGLAFSSQLWINGQHVGSWPGDEQTRDHMDNYTLPAIAKGHHVITVLVDHMGMDMQSHIGNHQFKHPRGITTYSLDGHDASDIIWKIAGNTGGEKYADKSRGPLNEGGIYYNRKGFHLPGTDTGSWKEGKPTDGIPAPGVHYYSARFELHFPDGYDIPLSVIFSNNGKPNKNYRAHLFINGWQFGVYVNNIGPQTQFPVPEGILNYHGLNTIGIGLTATDSTGNAIGSIQLVAGIPVQTGYPSVPLVQGSVYEHRTGAV